MSNDSVQILEIQTYSGPDQFTNIRKLSLIIFGIVCITVVSGVLAVLALYGIYKYVKYHKAKLRTFQKDEYKRYEKLKKYGLLGVLLSLVVAIVLLTVNMSFPLSEIGLLLQYYPTLIPIIVILIFLIWACVIPLYLVIYGILKRRGES